MRLAVYCLVVVLAALVIVGVVGMGVGLIGRHPSDVAEGPEELRKVYVDLDRLVPVHPGWGAVLSMRQAAAGVESGGTPAARGAASDVSWIEVPDMQPRTPVQRWKLEETASERSDIALAELEAQQIQALDARVRATRKTMIDSTEADIRIRSFELEQEAAKDISAISRKRIHDQINLRLKVDSLKAMLSRPGVQDEEVSKRLTAAEKELAEIESLVDSEIARVNAVRLEAVAGLRENAESKIDLALETYYDRERRNIVDRIREARNQVVSEVNALDDIYAPRALGDIVVPDSDELAGRPAVSSPPAYTAGRVAGELASESQILEARIRKDVAAAVSRLARDRNVVAVFAQQTPGLTDETETFAALMRDWGWMMGGPVLGSAKSM